MHPDDMGGGTDLAPPLFFVDPLRRKMLGKAVTQWHDKDNKKDSMQISKPLMVVA
jgi:hypothetical protein